MVETEKTEYFDLTPRKRAMIFEAAQELASAASSTLQFPDRSGPPFVTETSRRGRALGRSGGIAKGSPNCQPTLDKENVANVEAACTPDGGKSTLTKAALKRRQVVDDLAQAQADARSRLCIFKTKTDATIGDNADAEPGDRMESAAQAFEISVGSRAASQGYTGELTVAQGPVLRTAIRSSSRDGRSLSIPMRGLHSVGEAELSQRSRGTSREQAPLEQSVRSMQSMRSVRSMQTMKSATSVNYGSLVGRSVCTRPLTFPTGPVLATEARSRSHSVGARTPPAGTPEKHSRSVSVSSSRSVSRTPSQLTVPRAPLLATELRSRSRSVGVRTPSHSVGTPERSVRSCCPTSVPNGCSVRNRSRSVDMRTPSAKTASKGPLKPHRPRSRSHSVDMRTPAYTPNVTVPKGPVLSTELRSRSRLRTPSAHSVGTPDRERSVRSCHTPESYHSCSSVRDSSVRSRNGQPRPLTVPVGPLLETEFRSQVDRCRRSAVSQVEQEAELRSHRGCRSALSPVEQDKVLLEVAEMDSASIGVTLQCEESSQHGLTERASSSERHHGRRKCKSPGAASDADAASREEEEEKLNLPEEPECVSPLSLPEDDARVSLPTTPRANNAHAEVVMRVVAQLTNTSARSSFDDAAVDKPVPLRPDSLAANTEPALSSLLDFLPGCEDAAIPAKPDERCSGQQATTTGNELQESLCESSDFTASAESRAASRKQEVLAKVAEDHANIRKQRFVFGKPGTTPIRTPTRKTVGDPSRAEVGINKIGSLG